jgi:hypothetical protein
MKKAITTAVLLVALTGAARAQDVRYFPNQALDHEQGISDFDVNWYSKHLKAMGEPSLLELSKTRAHVYRFLWLRSFHNPVVVRLNVSEDGTSLLTVKVTGGQGGYKPGGLITNKTRPLPKEHTEAFLDRVRGLDYWSLPTREPINDVGLDGAEWVLEAVKDGRYKLVVRWSPRNGPVRALGLTMVNKLAELKIPDEEMY